MVKVYDQALAFLRSPEQLVSVRQRELPAELTPLLRLAAGEAEACAAAVAQTGVTPETMREAAGLFLQQLLFVPDGDSYRVLGVRPDASEERIKEHHRWLVRWLHPDRNPDGWEAVYVNRVNAAWQDLRNPARRDEYDRLQVARRSAREVRPDPGADRSRRLDEFRSGGGLLSPRAIRVLPVAVMGGLAVVAVLALLVLHAQQPEFNLPQPAAETPLDAEAQAAWLADAAGTAETRPASPPRPSPARIPRPAQPRSTLVATPTPAVGSPSAAPAAIELPERAVRPGRSAGTPAPSSNRVAQAGALEPRPASRAAGNKVPQPLHAGVRDLAPQPPAPVAVATVTVGSQAAPGQPSRQASGAVAVGSAPVARPATVETPPAAAPAANALVQVATPTVQAPRNEPAPSSRELIDAQSARALVQNFSRAYEAGDLNAMTSLFASGARGNARERMLRDYRRLFRESARRSFQVSNVSWISRGPTATIFGSFDARIAPIARGRARHIRGDIRFDLRDEGGQLRIVDLRHDGTQG